MIFSEILPLLRQSNFCLVFLSAVLGAIVGLEREASGKPAGIRTCALMSMSITLATLMSYQCITFILPHLNSAGISIAFDPSRIASIVMQATGMLAACCVIFSKDRFKLYGVTTSVALFVTAAIGLAVGFGFIALAVQVTILTLAVMFGIGWLEKIFRNKHKKTKETRHGKRKKNSNVHKTRNRRSQTVTR